MGSKGGDNVLVSESDKAGGSEATVEIKIKTLDSQTYTLRVDKCVPVPALKEQIATVTGVLSEQQRLICRGKVLKDDQLLSAYHVEDGHTLHLVVRQPVPPSSESFPDNPATDPASSSGHAQGNLQAPGVLLGTFNISEQGDGVFPDLSRIISTVIGSLGITNIGGGSEVVESRETSSESLRPFSVGGLRSISRQQDAQAAPGVQSNSHSGGSALPTAVPLDPLQPPVIPDSLTTLSQYLSHLREEFRSSVRDQSNNSQATDAANTHGQGLDGASQTFEHGGLPTPASLAEVLLSTRQMLSEQAGESLLQLARQIQDHDNVTDPFVRTRIQSDAVRSGVLLQNMGALLLELGRTTMTLRIGQTPADAVVNAGPAVFISTSRPNPIMVQLPLPFPPGTNFGAIPAGTVQPDSGFSGGSVGSSFLPRNIDIRIRAGSLIPSAVVNQREPTGAQPGGQTDPAPVDRGNSASQGTGGFNGSPPSTRDSEVRMVPIRTTVVTVPASVSRAASDSSRNSSGPFYPVIARVQHVTSVNLNRRRDPSVVDGEHNRRDVESAQQPNLNSGVQQNSEAPGADGNTHSNGGTPNSQGFSHIPSRLDQLLSTIFSAEQIDGTGTNFQEVGANSATGHEGATPQGDTTTQEAMLAEGDEGTFLSNLLHQIMPLILQNTSTGSDDSSANGADNTPNRNTQLPPTYAQENSDRGASSRRPGNPASPPEPKRQRRE